MVPSGTGHPLRIAIVGSGPSAMFVAEALLESGRPVEISVLERLPVPFGLVRFGVAPDHQTTKRAADSMQKTLGDPSVKFFGNVSVGRDVSVDELKALFDAVVLATGASNDVALKISGANLDNVIGSSRFVGWYNGHPDHAACAPNLDAANVAIVGLGNVALDVARILAKNPAELEATDIADYALKALRTSVVRDIFIVGRRSAFETKFSYPELRELQTLRDAVPVIDASSLHHESPMQPTKAQARNFEVFRSFAANDPLSRPKRIHFVLNATPVAIEGSGTVERLVLEQRIADADPNTTMTREIQCGLVVTAIGFCSQPISSVGFDDARNILSNEAGKVGDGIFVAGWAGRGPSGVIGSNKPDAYRVASRIVAEHQKPASRQGWYRSRMPAPAARDFLGITGRMGADRSHRANRTGRGFYTYQDRRRCTDAGNRLLRLASGASARRSQRLR